MKSMQKGFTLIELMIVVAIIAILAAIAIPQYQDYITRSQFTESQTVADGLKVPIQEYFTQTGSCPKTLGQDGIDAAWTSYAGKYVEQAEVKDGSAATGAVCDIDVTFKPVGSVSKGVGGTTVVFQGVNNGGSINWVCDATSQVENKYKPQVCRH